MSLLLFLNIKGFFVVAIVIAVKLLYLKELLLKWMSLVLVYITPATVENEQRLLKRETCVLGEIFFLKDFIYMRERVQELGEEQRERDKQTPY